MNKYNQIQTNFTSGQLTLAARGRSDLAQYLNGAERIENFRVKPHGGLWRRPGTRYVSLTKDNREAVLVPFKFSTDQAYVLEFGEKYIRFRQNDEFVMDPGPPVDILELETPYLGEDLADLSFAQSCDILYICHRLYEPSKLSRTDDGWKFEKVEFNDGPYFDYDDRDIELWLTDLSYRTKLTSTEADFLEENVDQYVEYFDGSNLVLGVIKEFID